MISTENTIATMRFFWSIGEELCGASGALDGLAGKRLRRRNGIEAAPAPRSAATQASGRQPASPQRPVHRHRFGGVGRARRLVAAGADKEVGERQLVATDRAAQAAGKKPSQHVAGKLAI